MGFRIHAGMAAGPRLVRSLATLTLALQLAGGALAAPAPANPPAAAAAAQQLHSVQASASLAETPAEASSQAYNFIVQPPSEPSGMQLLLGGLLAVAFMIRNRFRQR